MDRYKVVNKMLHNQKLLIIFKIIQIELISQHYNNLLARNFGINKTKELISRHHNNLLARNFDINKTKELTSQKYYWPNLKKNVEAYVKDCNICLALKIVRYKPYNNLKILLLLTYQ